MPFTFLRPDEPGTTVDDNLVYVLPRGAGLRFNFGTRQREAEAEVLMVNWRADALDELWAITPEARNLEGSLDDMLDAVVQESGAIDCTLSVDGGTTYLYWDGADWTAAGASDWSTFREVNANIAEIPRADNQLRFKIRLRRGTDQNKTPEFGGLKIGYSLVPHQEIEDPTRTMKRVLNDVRLRFREKYQLATADGLSSVDVDHPLPIESVVSVYNLTTDPKRSTDIANGFAGSVISFTGAQNDADIVEISWVATIPVRIANPDLDLVGDAERHVPAILIQASTAEVSKSAKLSDVQGYYTKNFATKKYWKEQAPIPTEYRFNIWALAADENLSIKIINAAYRYIRDLSTSKPVRAALSGQETEMIEFTPVFANQTDTSENLSAKTFTFILYVRDWLGEITTGPLAENLVVILEE